MHFFTAPTATQTVAADGNVLLLFKLMDLPTIYWTVWYDAKILLMNFLPFNFKLNYRDPDQKIQMFIFTKCPFNLTFREMSAFRLRVFHNLLCG